MNLFENVTKQDYQKIANDVLFMSKKSETELFQVLGHGLYDLGVDASDSDKFLLKRVDKGVAGISSAKGFNYIAKTKPLTKAQAEKKGRGFWKKFGKKIKKEICSNPDIIKIINGEATLKDKLVIAIPAILAAIGGSIVLGPLYIALISIVLSIIIKSGLGAYCEV